MSSLYRRKNIVSLCDSSKKHPIVLITREGEAFIGKRYPGAFVWVEPERFYREATDDTARLVREAVDKMTAEHMRE